jgi:hypothetical protein
MGKARWRGEEREGERTDQRAGERKGGRERDRCPGVFFFEFFERGGGREAGAQGFFAARSADLSRASCVSKCDELRGFTSFLRSRHRKAPSLYVLKESAYSDFAE